jgi:hypothetical protein
MTMTIQREHPTDDDLMLHGYRELPDDEDRAIARHLELCAACGIRWRQLTEFTASLDILPVPEPDAAFEERIWARVSSRISRERPTWTTRHVIMIGAWAAIIGLIAGAAYTWRGSTRAAATPDMIAAHDGNPQAMRERVLLTALNDHFSQTEVLLTELLNAPEAAPDVAFERETAADLVASGRLYRQTASQNGDAELASMLDDLEGVLVEVARSPERVDRREFAAIRTRIEDDDLLFKVRAVTSEVRDRRRSLTP